MSTNLTELCYSSSSSSLDPSDIIEQYADSDINELSQPPIYDLDAEVSRLLDHSSSGSESDDESSSPSSPLNKRQESQTKSHYEPSSTGGRDDVELSQPSISTEVNEQLDHHSKSTNPLFQRTDMKHDARLKDHHETRSVRGSGGIATAPPVTEMTKDPALTLHFEDSGGMLLASKIPQLELGENLLAGKHLSLHQLQPEGLKPTSVGSLLETPSSSSCQLDDDSDECSPKPLSEELEEAANRKMVEDKPPSPNQGMLAMTDSDDCSDSKSYDTEEESECEDLKSGEEMMSGEEIKFELEDGDPSPQNLSNEEELPSPLLIALTTTATQQSSHGSVGNVGETKNMFQSNTTCGWVVQSSNDRASKHPTVTKSQVEMESSPMHSKVLQRNLELIPATGGGEYQVPVYIQNIQDERMMPKSNETGHSHIQPGSRSNVDPPHSTRAEADGHTAVVSQRPIQQNEDSTTMAAGKKIKRFLPSKKFSASGGIGRAAAHGGALVLSNALTTQFHLESRREFEITPQKYKWQASNEEDNAPSSKNQAKYELQSKDLTSEVSSISTAGEVLSPTIVSLKVFPHESAVRDKPSSSKSLPGVPPPTSAMGLRRPLKGILKKKSSYERSSTSTAASVYSDEDKDHKHFSKGSTPLSSKIAPSEEICSSSKISDDSSSTRVSSEDLDRTLTEESNIIHSTSSSATPTFGKDAIRPSNSLPYKLDQTENEDTAITGDGDIPNECNVTRIQDNFKQQLLLNSSITMQPSGNHQHTAAANSLQPTSDSKLVEHVRIDCEIPPPKNDKDEPDGLHTISPSLRVNNDLVDKASYN